MGRLLATVPSGILVHVQRPRIRAEKGLQRVGAGQTTRFLTCARQLPRLVTAQCAISG